MPNTNLPPSPTDDLGRQRQRHRTAHVVLSLALLAALAACSNKEEPKAGGGAPAGGGMPPATVGVLTVAPQVVGLLSELPGRVEAVRVAQVRARVTGVVQKRQFVEGSEVRVGQPLFLIDPAPYQAALDSASAQLARAQAVLAQTTATAERYKPLAEARAISQQDYVNAQAAQKGAEADVAAGRAAVQVARINLGYTQVTAPIAGRIGRALVTEGALVRARARPRSWRWSSRPHAVRQLHPVGAEVLRLRAPWPLPAARRGQRRARGRARAGACWTTAANCRAARQAAVQRPVGGPDLRPGHAARRGAQPAGTAAARAVRAGAAGAGRATTAVLLPQQAVTRGARATRCWWWAKATSPRRGR
jgi:membrane fusion protein (multidrug efflux system)